jgi:tetratricopeptide (TPR) repeat protein
VLLGGLALFSTPLRDRGGAVTIAPLPAELCPESGDTATADSNRFRTLTWQGTLAMARKRPLLGWGAGTFETAFPPHQVAGYTRHAHNSYLQFFAEQGFLAPLAWVALVLAAFIGAWRLPRGPEWAWAAGVAGALAAAAAHNVLDSLIYVPAIGLVTWSLAGMGLAGASRLRESEEPAPRRAGWTRLRTAALVGGVIGLLLTGWHAFGRSILAAGREEMRSNPAAAVDTLTTSERLLPFDHQVAVAQAQAYRAAYRFDQAVEEAGRALRLAPYRPPTYGLLADLRNFMGQGDQALYQYAAGVRNMPKEVHLLYPYAQLLEKVHRRQDALDIYRQIVEIEESPIGQVRALGEVRDYRPARAHVQLAIAADVVRRPDEALAHRKAAACILAQRRRLFTNNPTSYVALGDWDARVEQDLRSEEGGLWRRLAQDYRTRGENHLADLAQQQVTAVDASREALQKVISEVEEAARGQ